MESVAVELGSGGLLVNYRCDKAGSVRVQAIDDKTGEVAASHLLKGDAVRAPVPWDFAPAADTAYRFRFTLVKASLYAIEFKK